MKNDPLKQLRLVSDRTETAIKLPVVASLFSEGAGICNCLCAGNYDLYDIVVGHFQASARLHAAYPLHCDQIHSGQSLRQSNRQLKREKRDSFHVTRIIYEVDSTFERNDFKAHRCSRDL